VYLSVCAKRICQKCVSGHHYPKLYHCSNHRKEDQASESFFQKETNKDDNRQSAIHHVRVNGRKQCQMCRISQFQTSNSGFQKLLLACSLDRRPNELSKQKLLTVSHNFLILFKISSINSQQKPGDGCSYLLI
jgi:hypothetical protein